MADADRAIKGVSRTRICIVIPGSLHVMGQAESVIRDLFARYQPMSRRLAGGMAGRPRRADEAARARRIADFIAGMTDRYALAEHGRLFDSTPELR